VALEIDPGKTALVLIDLQAGILANTLAPYDSETVVANGLTLARAVKAAGGVRWWRSTSASAPGGSTDRRV
jgi:nicotinamidase-related amidase